MRTSLAFPGPPTCLEARATTCRGRGPRHRRTRAKGGEHCRAEERARNSVSEDTRADGRHLWKQQTKFPEPLALSPLCSGCQAGCGPRRDSEGQKARARPFHPEPVEPTPTASPTHRPGPVAGDRVGSWLSSSHSPQLLSPAPFPVYGLCGEVTLSTHRGLDPPLPFLLGRDFHLTLRQCGSRCPGQGPALPLGPGRDLLLTRARSFFQAPPQCSLLQGRYSARCAQSHSSNADDYRTYFTPKTCLSSEPITDPPTHRMGRA